MAKFAALSPNIPGLPIYNLLFVEIISEAFQDDTTGIFVKLKNLVNSFFEFDK